MKDKIYTELISKFKELIKEIDLYNEEIVITGRTLTDEEALGNPDRKDFPLLTGKESLMQATFRGSIGQAFTDKPGPFKGSLKEILSHKPVTNHDRAVLISTINAVCTNLNLCGRSIHCKDNEPETCADSLSQFIDKEHGNDVKIALVGYQPSMLEKLSAKYQVRNLDLDKDKVDTVKFGVKIEHGINQMNQVLSWCDIILCTGSTITNNTLTNYLTGKPVYFYGTTICGPAALLGFSRFCDQGK